MIKRAYFQEALSPDKEAALREWKEAQLEFSNESRYFQRTKRSLPDKEDCNPFQRVALETAKDRYSIAAKKYNKARSRYMSAIAPEREAASALAEEFKRIVQDFDAAAIPSIKEVRAAQKREEEIALDPRLDAIREAALKNMQSPVPVKELELTDELENFETSPVETN
jgi:hypothetical protein